MNAKKPEVLFLVHRVPFPPNRGDRIRSYHMLAYLSKYARVSLATLADEPLAPGTQEELAKLCGEVLIEQVGSGRWIAGALSLLGGKSATEGLFHSARLWRRLDQLTRSTRFDRVIVFCSSMVPYLRLPGLNNVPALVDLVDVDSQKFLDYSARAGFIKRMLYQLEGARLRKLEATIPSQAQVITLVSEAEAKLFRSVCPNKVTHAMKNGVDLAYFQPRTSPLKPFHCLFVGALDYPPNIDGVLWLANEVWPGLKEKYPRATLAIVGRNPSSQLKTLAKLPGVEVVGTVPDVRPYLAQASVVLAPLRIARGVQNKVLEAMAMAKGVVASPAAAEGLDVTDDAELLVAREPADWIRCVGRLFIETSTCERLSQGALQFVQQNHNWSECLRQLQRWVAAPVAGGAAASQGSRQVSTERP